MTAPLPDLEAHRAAVLRRASEIVAGNGMMLGTEGECVEPNATAPRAIVVRLSEVQAKPICYLWEPRVPLGYITVLEGDPGRSKSTLALEIAAAVSTGRALPGGSPSAPRDVVIISYEDAAADVLLPRLLAAGGDPRRVHVIQGVRARPDAEPSVAVFPDDVAAVADVVQDRRAALLVVDPISAGLAGSIDAHRDADVRRGLAPLAALAEQQHLAVLAIRHLRKGTGRAIVSGGGSIAFAAAARVVIRVDEDPQDPAAGIVSIVKHNLSAHPHSLKFARVSVELAGDVSAPRIEWRGESTYSADDLAALREEVGGGPMRSTTPVMRSGGGLTQVRWTRATSSAAPRRKESRGAPWSAQPSGWASSISAKGTAGITGARGDCPLPRVPTSTRASVRASRATRPSVA